MDFVRKALLPIGGVVALALVIMIASPRAARALAAAMVQIMNTPTNAVPAVLAPAANQIDREVCSGFQGGTANLVTCNYNVVTSGKTRVIDTFSIFLFVPHGVGPTSAYLSSNDGTSTIYVPLIQQASAGALDYYVGNVTGARFYVAAGTYPSCNVVLNSTSEAQMECHILGYSVPAQ